MKINSHVGGGYLYKTKGSQAIMRAPLKSLILLCKVESPSFELWDVRPMLLIDFRINFTLFSRPIYSKIVERTGITFLKMNFQILFSILFLYIRRIFKISEPLNLPKNFFLILFKIIWGQTFRNAQNIVIYN